VNRSEVSTLLDDLAERYPQTRPFTTKTLDVWHRDLEHIPAEAVNAVLPSVLLDSPDFCPPLPKIMAALSSTMKPSLDIDAAWEIVHKACSRVGCQQPGACELFVKAHMPEHSEAINAAARAIGWFRLGTSDYSQHEGMFNQFRRCLESAGKRVETTQRREAIGIKPPLPVDTDQWNLPWGVTDADKAATPALKGGDE
jgi:hypothetical protein